MQTDISEAMTIKLDRVLDENVSGRTVQTNTELTVLLCGVK